jgi:hypothetical protein
MSALRILWPDDTASAESDCDPAILSFETAHAAARPHRNVIERARVLYGNRHCPVCRYPVVIPIELDDAVLNRCGQPIPGTATLVGFRCRGCRAEWSV